MPDAPIVVLGASFAGCFAAAALARAGREVLLLERDRLPSRPEPRRGVPQGRLPHVLLARTLRDAEALLPGLTDDLRAAGALTVDTGRLAWVSDWGWMPPGPSIETLSLTRPLLEHVVRAAVLEVPGVTLHDGADARGLVRSGSSWRVSVAGGGDILAEVVVDATGRSSRLPAWFAQVGATPPAETVIDAQIGYATRTYAGPRNGIEAVMLQVSRRTLVGGSALPVEHDKWLLTAVGCGPRRPPRDVAGYEAALHGLHDPILADLARTFTPVGDVVVHRQTANRRLHYEQAERMPPGLLVVGDALCTFDPLYAQGIAVAAMQARVLQEHATEVSGARSLRPVQRELARCARLPWLVAAGGDAHFPTSNRTPTLLQRLGDRWARRLTRASTHGDLAAGAALATTYQLLAPPSTLVRPRVVLAAVRAGSGQPVPRPAQLPAASARG